MGLYLLHVRLRNGWEYHESVLNEIEASLPCHYEFVCYGDTAHYVIAPKAGRPELSDALKQHLAAERISDYALVELGPDIFAIERDDEGELISEQMNELVDNGFFVSSVYRLNTLTGWLGLHQPLQDRRPSFGPRGLLLTTREAIQEVASLLTKIRLACGGEVATHFHGQHSIFLSFCSQQSVSAICNRHTDLGRLIRARKFSSAAVFEIGPWQLALHGKMSSLKSWFEKIDNEPRDLDRSAHADVTVQTRKVTVVRKGRNQPGGVIQQTVRRAIL